MIGKPCFFNESVAQGALLQHRGEIQPAHQRRCGEAITAEHFTEEAEQGRTQARHLMHQRLQAITLIQCARLPGAIENLLGQAVDKGLVFARQLRQPGIEIIHRIQAESEAQQVFAPAAR